MRVLTFKSVCSRRVPLDDLGLKTIIIESKQKRCAYLQKRRLHAFRDRVLVRHLSQDIEPTAVGLFLIVDPGSRYRGAPTVGKPSKAVSVLWVTKSYPRRAGALTEISLSLTRTDWPHCSW